MRIFGLISILIVVSIALFWFSKGIGVSTPNGKTGDIEEGYTNLINSAEDAAESLRR